MEIRCPKCGAMQPESDVCIKCGVIISKYLRYIEKRPVSAIERRGHIEDNTSGKKLPILPILFIVVFVFVVIFLIFGTGFLKDSKGKYDKEAGIYSNEKLGFKFKIPISWKTYTVKEAIQCQTIVNEYADYYFFLASPTEPSRSLLVVNIPGTSTEVFKSTPWENYVAKIAARHSVTFNRIDTINDLKVYRVGYEIAGSYREDNLFIANEQLIEIYFYVTNPDESIQLVQEMKKVIEENLESF